MRSTPVPATVLLLAALAVPLRPADAQSGQEIMEKALEAHEQRMEGVSEYTVTQRIDVMGAPVTRRFVKRTVDGRPVFVAASREGAGRTPSGWGNPYRLFARLSDRARNEGREGLDGGQAWKVSVDDFSGVDVGSMTPEGARGEFRPERATFHLDTETFAIRRVVMRGTMESETGSGPVKIEARFDDYREVDGLLHPFHTEISVEGMNAVLTEEELAEARRRLEAMRARLDSLSEAERAMVEPVVGPKIEQLERTVETGRLDVTVEVQDLQVGPGGSGGGG